MSNTILFYRDNRGGAGHVEYLPTEMEEQFTAEQRKAFSAGQTVTVFKNGHCVIWVSANAVCDALLKIETSVSNVMRIRADERAAYVRQFGAESKIVAKFDRRTAQLLEAAKRSDALGI